LSPSVALRRVVAHVLAQAGYEIEGYDPSTERTNDYAQWARRRRQQIELEGAHPVLIARVPPGMKEAFDRYASARNDSAPSALLTLVKHVVKSAHIEVGELTPPKPPALRSERVTVRFSTDEMEAAGKLAEEFGGVREWIVALVRSRLQPDAPQFTLAEVQALYESNRELWAIGRNVNQIAHAMNLDMQQAGRLEGSVGRVRELDALKAAIDAHTARVVALCNASFERWGTE
ncbi:MAG: plasmid mobilization relaxosome protein MobC, partial [Polyangiaceae bacterium]